MTKINGISPGSQISSQNKTQGTDADLFKKTLDKAFKTKDGIQAEKTSKGSLNEIQSTPLIPVEDAPQAFKDKTGRLLDLLDRYAKALGNPNTTLREIEPLVKDLKTSAEELLEKAESDIPRDSRLSTIARESAMRANIEYIKFHRGDYI